MTASPVIKVKLFTHEAIVHAQTLSIEKLLNRKVEFDISLNVKGVRSNIQFTVNEAEITQIKKNLGYTVYTLNADQWIALI